MIKMGFYIAILTLKLENDVFHIGTQVTTAAGEPKLTPLPLDKMATILQATFLDLHFSWLKNFDFWPKFPKGPIDNNPALI